MSFCALPAAPWPHQSKCNRWSQQISRTGDGRVAVDETITLLHPPLPLAGVSIVMERGCQSNDSLVNGWHRAGRGGYHAAPRRRVVYQERQPACPMSRAFNLLPLLHTCFDIRPDRGCQQVVGAAQCLAPPPSATTAAHCCTPVAPKPKIVSVWRGAARRSIVEQAVRLPKLLHAVVLPELSGRRGFRVQRLRVRAGG